MFSALILVISTFYVFEYQAKRTIVHDPTSKCFTVYRNLKVITSKPITDLYIKMVFSDIGEYTTVCTSYSSMTCYAKLLIYSGSKGFCYRLIIDGNGLEQAVPLPGETSNRKVCA